MIGHNTTTGKTTFLELNDGYLTTNEFLQPNVYVPTPDDENYEAAWKAPGEVAFQSCNSCHNSDPFIPDGLWGQKFQITQMNQYYHR